MGDTTQAAYQISKDICDDGLAQGSLFSRLSFTGIDAREIARRELIACFYWARAGSPAGR